MPPKPQPTQLKLVKGNPGKRPISRDEVSPDASIPKPPNHLDPVAKTEWKRISESLYNLQILSDIDRSALAAYCQSYGRWVKAENKVRKDGLVITTSNGNVIQSPYVSIANKAMMIMHKFAVEFGMTPSARVGLKVGGKKKESKPEDEFF